MRRPKTSPILPALDAVTDSKTEFFMTASHQLKSPVAIVQWCLRSMMEMPDLKNDARKLVDKALAQSDSMSQLLSEMLQVFRLMRKDQATVRTLVAVDLATVLKEAFTQCGPQAERCHVKLSWGPLEKLPTVYADAGYLKQALVNIIDNAIKYSPEGGVVDIEGTTERNEVIISVLDRGIGIPLAEQGRLFTEFFRGAGAKDKTADGTGLGLVLVKHIMQSFGGSVTFKSDSQNGTIFSLHLPYKSRD